MRSYDSLGVITLHPILVVVSPPCVLLLVSSRSEEVILRKVRKVFVGGCHGNDCIHVRTKFHLHVCYTEQVIAVKK